jgi:ABC transporter substrate binding protein
LVHRNLVPRRAHHRNDELLGNDDSRADIVERTARDLGSNLEFQILRCRSASVVARAGRTGVAGEAAASPAAALASLAARNRLPAVYNLRAFAEVGDLLSYGVNETDNFRRAATYADRILQGTYPSELPVQAPVKFELVINLKTAKALGLTIPETLLATAGKVIQ